MESLSPQVVSAAKLPILNPNEFDLWKMRIEQYFLMTDYSLWEVILNDESPAPTRVIEGVVQLFIRMPSLLMEAIKKSFGGNKETKKKLISQLEILGESLSQEDINLKFLRSLPTEWMTHTFIWRNKIDLEEQSLDDLFNSLKIYEAMVKSSSSASTSTQNIAFVSSSNTDSTTKPVSVAASIFAVSAKIPIYALQNVDTLSNAVIYSSFASQSNSPQLDNDDLKQIDVNDLEEIDLKWQMAMLTVRARRFPQKTRRNLGANGPTSMGFDMSTVECYNCHMKGHFARECSYDWSFQAEEEPTNYALMAITSSSSSSSDNEVVSCSKACTKAYATLQSHYDKLTDDFRKSQFDVISYKTGLESVKSDENLPPSPIYDRYQSRDGYHAVPPSYTGTFMPSKPDLVFHNAPNDTETIHTAFIVELNPTKPANDLSHTYSFVQPLEQVKTPRPSLKPVETSILNANTRTAIPKPKRNGNHRKIKACFVCKSLDHLIKDCDYYEKKMAPTPFRNHAQRGNHQQYARMILLNPQKHVVPTPVLTQSKLVPITAARPVTAVVPKPHVTRPRQAKSIVTKPHSPPRRHINRSLSPKASNFPPKVTAVKVSQVNAAKGVQGKWEWKPKCPILDHVSRNTSASITLKRFDFNDALGRSKSEPEFEGRKPEYEFHVSLSSSAQTKKHDARTKREAKGKSPVESLTRYRNLSAEFEDFSANSINEVNAADSPVSTVGPTHGKSSYVDTSQLPDDPNMPELEDITYSDDEEDVGA
nr:hypothetical protein [Tanacetum cinerariifolium]